MNWKKLQNGSDIRGVALEGVIGEEVNLTPEVAQMLGKSFVHWLWNFTSQTNVSIAVGTDSRISGTVLKNAFIAGLCEAGAKVFDCGLASTPAMFMTTVSGEKATMAGVMITASHLPFNRNGFKFFTNKGGLDKKDITEILKIAEENEYISIENKYPVESWSFIDEYASFLVDYIRKMANIQPNFEHPLQGLKIIVDAGNGAGGFFVSKVLDQLGADTRGSQFLNPDGNFPNHVPNPEDKEAMQSICEAVIRENADLGVIFDTDVDRSAIVDSKGNPVNRNALIAMISAVILKEHPGSTIVTDSITSDELTKFIEEELKGKHHRFQRGYKNVINESINLNNQGEESWLAIETSGHAALKENYFLDDGAYLVAKLLVEMAKLNAKGRTLTDLIKKLEQPVESRELRFNILEEDFGNYGKQVLAELEKKVIQLDGWEVVSPNYEGLRVRCTSSNEKGWFLLRLSLHDPVMPLNIESDIEGGVEIIAVKLELLLQDFHGLKTNVLKC
ncbi:MAG TPA: phosphomannomutase/phosphoglucomutase [Paludibacter sp.]